MDNVNKSFIKGKELIARRGNKARNDPSADRLPPGQRLIDDLQVLDLGIKPDIVESQWTLSVSGCVDNPLELSWEQLQSRYQKVTQTSDFHCVTTWSVFDCEWGGFLLKDILASSNIQEKGSHVLFTAYDGYTTNLKLADAMDDEVLLATEYRGEPLTKDHGAPCRIIVPHLYAWKGAKWVKSVQVLTDDQPGFWEVRGYSNHGDPWTEDRYA